MDCSDSISVSRKMERLLRSRPLFRSRFLELREILHCSGAGLEFGKGYRRRLRFRLQIKYPTAPAQTPASGKGRLFRLMLQILASDRLYFLAASFGLSEVMLWCFTLRFRLNACKSDAMAVSSGNRFNRPQDRSTTGARRDFVSIRTRAAESRNFKRLRPENIDSNSNTDSASTPA